MSFRDLRNMSEILRTVGYPRLISLENFRTPNFRLVADIGIWLVRQYEPKAEFPSSVETEQERILFVRLFAEFIVTKVHVNINTKRLYQADGYAVKELIKVASVLHNAMKEAKKAELGITSVFETKNVNFDVSGNLDKLKKARSLASEITQRGVVLYDMLTKEVVLREARNTVLGKAFELDEVEKLIRSAVSSSHTENTKFQTMIGAVEGNLNNLDIKIEKKKQEIERSEKRFQTLKKVRPAFMDEYERIQEELNSAYNRYVNRFRCLTHLQKQMEELNRVELERKAEERLLRQDGDEYFFMDKNSRGDMFPSGSEDDEDESQSQEPFNKNGMSASKLASVSRNSNNREYTKSRGPTTAAQSTKMARPQATAGARTRSEVGGRSRQVYGSMLGGGDESGESESDLILVDGEGDNSDFGSDEPDDEDDLDLQNVALKMARTAMEVPAHMQELNGQNFGDNLSLHSAATASSGNINHRVNGSDPRIDSPYGMKVSSAIPNGNVHK